MLELLVAGDAGHRRVCVVERELVVLVRRDVDEGRPKAPLAVAVEAARGVSIVRVDVARRALRFLRLEGHPGLAQALGTGPPRPALGVCPVAGGALDLGVSPLQPQPQCRVIRDRECARRPTVHAVTRGAGAAVGAARQLPPVVVGVAVAALRREGPHLHCRGAQLRGWHSGRILQVTGGAPHLLVTTFQRVLRESVLRHRVRGRPPALDRVAGSAVHDSAGEGGRAGVRVRVAVRAIRERRGADHLPRRESVTLLARHFAVATAQRIAGAVVIELAPVDGLEIRRPVAVTARRAEAPAVDVLVTGDAIPLEPHPAPLRRAPPGQLRGWGDPQGRLVAVGAGGLLMAPLELPSRAGVVEALGVAARPADQREVLAGVLGVAAGAALLAHAGVEPTPPLHEPTDLLMTVEAAGGHVLFAPPAVASDALQRPFQLLM